ncbi:MAG: hypothetical protein ABL999_03090 [Pyrinomonadaceae bacterium]
MKNLIPRLLISLFLVAAFLSSAMPCGPGYISPLFDTSSAPEVPYSDYAAGRLGIVKSSFHRSVLIAAYRHIAGNGLSTPEQQALVEIWKAEIDNKDFRDDTVDEAVKTWVAKRKDAVGKEEKVPEIYAERSWGGYDFFPNCTKNAFETAAQTLADRTSSYGSTDPNVLNWIAGQDQVFQNCSSGKRSPDPVPVGAPVWLQKDRDYQIAAAAFYSLDYNESKKRFADIAQDTESPWKETADYLVARTLIRQASLSKTPAASTPFYEEAEAHLRRFISGGKFSESAERLSGLIKYRLRPMERTSELAKNITIYLGNNNFRQDVIDYTWLLDKFENDVLTAEEKRKEAEKPKETNTVAEAVPTPPLISNANISVVGEKKNDEDLEIYVYSPTTSKSWRIFVKSDATDAEALTEAEKVVNEPMTAEMKTQVRDGRQRAYSARFTDGNKSTYEGGYWGEEHLTPTLLPAFLRQDEITDWLYCYQMKGAEAYLYSLKKYKEQKADLWLMTALSQADKGSAELSRLLEAANSVNRLSPAYTTIAFHTARILVAQNKQADARKLIDEMLGLGDTLPLSSRNSFMDLRLKLAETLEDFLKYSLKKPYGFDFNGDVGTIESIIAEQKTYFDPEYNKEGREAYEAQIEENYKEEKQWQSRAMFDSDLVEVLNQHFSTVSLIQVFKSPALPDYMRPRLALAIWTRAYLLNDAATVDGFLADLGTYNPEFQPMLDKIAAAKTPAARENAVLYFVLKNPILSPYIQDGMGKTDNTSEEWDSDDWWCEPYDSEYSDETNAEIPKKLPPRPAFLTAAQSQTAQNERKKLKAIGDSPKYLAARVLAWLKRAPGDKRVPEAIYIMIGANGWNKYGCGNNEELRDELAKLLKTRFPGNEWAQKLVKDEADR